MSGHTERFTGRVEEYERFRQRFPAEVLEVLRARCGLGEGTRAADVGAGTGMLTELLLEGGCDVVAVEPNPEMRAACGRLLGSDPRLRLVDAAAEATSLDAASQDLVTVGRAFHWFDRDRAVAEFRRILRPGGWLVLLWLGRARDSTALTRDYEALLRAFGRDYDVCQSNKRTYEGPAPFGPGEHLHVELPGEQQLTLEELLGQTQSYSVAPLPGDAKYGPMQEALRAFFTKWSRDGVLSMQTMCDVQGWQRGI